MSNNRKRTRQKFLVMRRNKNRAIIRKQILEISKSIYVPWKEASKLLGSFVKAVQKAIIEFSILCECSGGLNHDNPDKG